MRNNLLKIFSPLILASIAIFLCFKNYAPGTYLMGWDSLHSEFNFPLNVSRMFSRVWSQEQGVGAIAAHSDMADLPRILILWIASLVLPLNFLRYFYIFLCLVLGPLGVYFFLKYIFQKEKENFWVYLSAFLGGLFYLLNLGTLQNFYVPLEMFPTAFAFAPWIFLTGFKFLREGKRRNLLFFALSVILASPMAYAATQAYVIYAGLFLFLMIFVAISKGKKVKTKRLFALGIFVFVLNLYWILPNLYSLARQSDTITNAQTNKLFSPEAFLRNREYGDAGDILIQKNFLFDWRNFDFQTGQFKDLLNVWTGHLSGLRILVVGHVLGGFSLLGLAIGLLKRRKTALALLLPLAFCLFFLFNANPPLDKFYSYLYNHFGVFREALRMPFTKFSTLFELILAFYFGYFVFSLVSIRSKFLLPIKLIFIMAVTGGLVYWMLPAFGGQLLGANVRVSFPSEYFQLNQWFGGQGNGRIALFPLNTKFGWEYRSWGYEGSGFLTYGVPQPMFYRDFDRWSKFNEDFYNEASDALYGNEPDIFLLTLKKYQVKYLLLDESVTNPSGSPNLLYFAQIKDILSGSSDIREAAKFGFITIYETDFDTGSNFVSAPKEEIINTPLALSKGTLIARENLSVNRGFAEAYNCDLKKIGTVSKENSGQGILYKADGGGVSCDYLNYPDLKYNQGYVVHIAGENISGRSLKIYFTNFTTQRADLEELLPPGKFDKEFYVYPSKLAGEGYSLNFETRSYGQIASENLVTNVEIYIANSSADTRGEYAIGDNLQIQKVKKYGTWAYKVDIQGDGLIMLGQGYEDGWLGLQLKGSILEVLPHQMFDSWANAWEVPPRQSQSTVYLVYWPQLLEWGGMFLGILALAMLVWGPAARQPHGRSAR